MLDTPRSMVADLITHSASAAPSFSRLELLESRIDNALRTQAERLLKYGTHRSTCSSKQKAMCNCGLVRVLDEARTLLQ